MTRQKAYWTIHGKFYDLSKFDHPGGREILESARCESDATPMFESYHAMKDIDRISKMMKLYEIPAARYAEYGITDRVLTTVATQKKYSFESYRILSQMCRSFFGGVSSVVSPSSSYSTLASNYKANAWWVTKFMLLLIGFFVCHFFGVMSYLPFKMMPPVTAQLVVALLGLGSGFCFMCLGFVLHHDASHNAVFYRSSWNSFASRIWCSIGLMNAATWLKHHVYSHHSFTGEYPRDADLINLRPLARKTINDNYKGLVKQLVRIQHAVVPLYLVLIPGQFFGQCVAYFIGMVRGHMWRLNLSRVWKNTKWYEVVLFVGSIAVFVTGNIVGTLSFFFAANTVYYLSIFPDHDLFENSEFDETQTNDWAVQQICKSANFCTSNKAITELLGGINFQVVHHLFPTVCHVHYPKLMALVNEFCASRGIKIVSYSSLMSCFRSYLKTLRRAEVFMS